MALVVSGHVFSHHFAHLHVPVAAQDVWFAFNKAFAPMRLPLFFVISGMLSAPALSRDWAAVAVKKVGQHYYLYGLWVIPLTLLYAGIDTHVAYVPITSGWEALVVFVVPTSSLWYLYALAGYFVFAKALRSLPRAVPIGIAFVLSAWTASLGGEELIKAVGINLIYYVLGAYFPVAVRALAGRASLILGAVAVLAYGVVLALYFGGVQNLPAGRTALGVLAAAAGLIWMPLLTRQKTMRRLGSAIGRNTLTIYILHYPLLAIASVTLSRHIESLPSWAAFVYPFILIVVLVVLPIWIRKLTDNVGLSWLFSWPFPLPGKNPVNKGPGRRLDPDSA